jgi:hypothetical protein
MFSARVSRAVRQAHAWRQSVGDEIVPCKGQDAAPSDSFLPVPAVGGVCLFDCQHQMFSLSTSSFSLVST